MVAMEKVTFAPAVPGVKLGGLNEQLLSEGSPEQENEMALVKDPPTGAMARL